MLHPGTILVVEDDPAILELVGDVLRLEGYRVTAATTVEQALSALACLRFDAVLTDTLGGATVPSVDRWRALDRIRAAAEPTPVVIFSAHFASAFDGYRERGFADVLLKPFDLDKLLATVARAVEAHRQPEAAMTAEPQPVPVRTG